MYRLTMTKYRVCASFLAGVGFVSVLCLSLNIPAANFLLSALFAPGAIVIAPFNFGERSSVVALFGANVLTYSVLAFGVILLRFRELLEGELKRFSVRMLSPIVAISTLACFPALNPMLPVGMADLAKQERELQQALNPSVNLQDARSVLNNRHVEFGEQLQESDALVFQGPDKRINAEAGDRVIVSRWRTSAWSFPCGYDMEIILLFGPDEKLKDRYIRRFPLCP
jgi:hypothetical protein